jgi:hypothetical protein
MISEIKASSEQPGHLSSLSPSERYSPKAQRLLLVQAFHHSRCILRRDSRILSIIQPALTMPLYGEITGLD